MAEKNSQILQHSLNVLQTFCNRMHHHTENYRNGCYMSVQILFFAAVQVGVADWQPQLCGVFSARIKQRSWKKSDRFSMETRQGLNGTQVWFLQKIFAVSIAKHQVCSNG